MATAELAACTASGTLPVSNCACDTAEPPTAHREEARCVRAREARMRGREGQRMCGCEGARE
eukprot:15455372-Alexandrium_andersonii.AAC.1